MATTKPKSALEGATSPEETTPPEDTTPPEETTPPEAEGSGTSGSDPNVTVAEAADAVAERDVSAGYYATAEADDNSVEVSNKVYVGVSPEYANFANATDEPLLSEDPDQRRLEQAAADAEADRIARSNNIGFQGYATATPHPSERKNPASAYIDANRTILSKLTE